MTPDPWTCPDCDRTFARTGQTHKCERWSVDHHTRSKPAEIVDLLTVSSQPRAPSGASSSRR
ncbi:MAG: hypothetical protein ACR2FF_02535 [Mycobacteriales bacterium]|nr:MAG: hypothetical protein DLM56_10360 [Pseudonocardiales bacterium]